MGLQSEQERCVNWYFRIMPTNRNKDSSFTLLSNVMLVYQRDDLSQTHWLVLEVVWNCVRQGWEKCWSMTWASRRQLSSPLLHRSCSSLEGMRWPVLCVVMDVHKNKGTRKTHPNQEFIGRKHVPKVRSFPRKCFVYTADSSKPDSVTISRAVKSLFMAQTLQSLSRY